ncbi:hypothetical protein, partial [Vibrio parahaemolyticus]|uniref:hypothetical protein n=1 Tax=Vibrio parahaemolyticus TaxID=670 RepID=UPI001C5F9CA0
PQNFSKKLVIPKSSFFIHFEYFTHSLNKSLFHLPILRIKLTKNAHKTNRVAYKRSLLRSHQHTYPQF